MYLNENCVKAPSNSSYSTHRSSTRKKKDNDFEKKKTKLKNLIQKAKNKTTNGRFDQSDCPICFETFPISNKAKVIILKCNHKFCEPCLQSWYEARGTAINDDLVSASITSTSTDSSDNSSDLSDISSDSSSSSSNNELKIVADVSCPICRRITHFQGPTSNKKNADKNDKLRYKKAVISAETEFRLNSLKEQYPRLMPTYSLDSWVPLSVAVGSAAVWSSSYQNRYSNDYSYHYNSEPSSSTPSYPSHTYDSTPTYDSTLIHSYSYDSTPSYSCDFGGGSSYDGGGSTW